MKRQQYKLFVKNAARKIDLRTIFLQCISNTDKNEINFLLSFLYKVVPIENFYGTISIVLLWGFKVIYA